MSPDLFLLFDSHSPMEDPSCVLCMCMFTAHNIQNNIWARKEGHKEEVSLTVMESLWQWGPSPPSQRISGVSSAVCVINKVSCHWNDQRPSQFFDKSWSVLSVVTDYVLEVHRMVCKIFIDCHAHLTGFKSLVYSQIKHLPLIILWVPKSAIRIFLKRMIEVFRANQMHRLNHKCWELINQWINQVIN